MYKTTISANSDDDKIAIKTAKITSVKTGSGDFNQTDDVVVDGDGNITSYTAGTDSGDGNRLVRSNDTIDYFFRYTIGGKNDDNAYYARNVNVIVELSEEEAKFISFEPDKNAGETSYIYTFNNVSSTGGEQEAAVKLYVLNGANGSEISPKFTIKESTDTGTGVSLGKVGSNLEYEYENGNYTSTNVSSFENFLPTLVSSTPISNFDYLIINTQNGVELAGQQAIYDNQTGRFYTGILEVSVPKNKGTYFASEELSLPVTVTQTGNGSPTISDNWVRLYNNETIDSIEPVVADTPYSYGNNGAGNNQTRFPGSIAYPGGNLTISNIKQTFDGPSSTATGHQVLPANKIVLGTYAISFFSPRTVDDAKNDVIATLTIGNASVNFTNSYHKSTDYDLTSGFYDEGGNSRLTTSVDDNGAIKVLNSSTSKGASITYRTDFKYQKTSSNTGLKEVIKVDPIAFRVVPKSDKEDIDIEVSCGTEKCQDIDKDSFDVKYVNRAFSGDYYSVSEVDPRISPENIDIAVNGCANINIPDYNSDQIMNLYGGPCIKENDMISHDRINDSRDEDNNEIPITKVIVQTKEGVVLPDEATVTVKVYLRVRNVADITRSYQAGVVASTSDTDEVLYYYAPTIEKTVDPNNYVRSSFVGDTVNVNSVEPYADSIRIVNFTARQNITVTNKLSDGQTKTSYSVDENETIKYKVSTKIEDMNEQVGADDVWYFKELKTYVNIPNSLEYIPDSSLGNPEVVEGQGYKTLIYTSPWTKPNMKIEDIYFKAKLDSKLTGTAVKITVTSNFEPININGEKDMSEVNARNGSFTIYGTGSQTVLLSQTNLNPTTVDKDAEFTYALGAHNNAGIDVTDFIITDILPYNKDNRGTDIDGSYEVKVELPSSQGNAQLYCSTKDPKTLSGESNNSNDDFEECDVNTYVRATAIRVTGIDLLNQQTMDPIKVTLKTKNNKYGNKYVNNFVGGNRALKDKKSNDIEYNVISRQISGTVFYDSNEDGIRNEDEIRVSGLTATLYKVESGSLVETGKTVTTNKDGEYSFKNLDPGFYKVRIEYNSGSYDLALRYASENRAVDSDAYKIREGLAEISGKYAPGTVDGIDLTVFTNYKVENMDMGLIPRVSFGFEMKKFITQVDLNYNNAINTTKYNNESIVTLNVRNTLNATAKVYYGITIKNNSTQSGYVKLIQEDIPDGLTFDENDPYNKEWFKVGGVLQSNVLNDRIMEPGDTAYLQIALNMPNRETGNTFVNTVSMLDIEPYIPQELAKEAEFKTDTYSLGEAVSYAGVNWHVVGINNISDEEQDVTLLADSGTIPGDGMMHVGSGVYKWGDSLIKNYINGEWLNENSINAPILRDQVVCNDPSSLDATSYGGTLASEGTCTTGDYVTSKIRLLTYNEYVNIKNNVSDNSWLYAKDFWLMNTVNSAIKYDYYGKQTDETKPFNLLGVCVNSINTTIDISANSKKEVRPVITISSKNIIGQ